MIRLGVVLVPSTPWSQVHTLWRELDELGVAHGWVFDHLVWGGHPDSALRSAMPMLTAAALATKRMELGTLVATPNFRHPVTFAHELLTVDEIAGGRMIAGLGAGGGGSDLTVVQARPLPGSERRERFAEFLTTFQSTFAQRVVTSAGTYFRTGSATIWPGAEAPRQPPVLVAAAHPATIDLALQHAAGWIITGGVGGTADEWWATIDHGTRRFDARAQYRGGAPVDFRRLLLAEADSLHALESRAGMEAVIHRAAESGFTDVVVRWSYRPEDQQRQRRILEAAVRQMDSG